MEDNNQVKETKKTCQKCYMHGLLGIVFVILGIIDLKMKDYIMGVGLTSLGLSFLIQQFDKKKKDDTCSTKTGCSQILFIILSLIAIVAAIYSIYIKLS